MEVPVYPLPCSEMQRRAIRGCRSWNGGPESCGVGQSCQVCQDYQSGQIYQSHQKHEQL